MRTAKDKLNSLDNWSVWVFTKQETDFDEAVKSSKLFSEIPDKRTINIEDYFAKHHNDYDISTYRHRILVMSQLYGLLTKTAFYKRVNRYDEENCTAAFDEINKYQIKSKEYNTLKTEQLLKVKIHAIIDTANNNSDYHILPIIFIYKVLRTLEEKYNVQEVSIDHLYSYIMTCKNESELDEAVEHIYNGSPSSVHVGEYKSNSRIVAFLKNINLFIITNDTIKINPKFDNYFNDFIKNLDFDEINGCLYRDIDYAYFLNNIQGFNVNLIDVPLSSESVAVNNPINITVSDDENEGVNYQIKVDTIKEDNINEQIAKGSYKEQPVVNSAAGSKRKFKTNPMLGRIAIKSQSYQCCVNSNHITFISKRNGKQYMEAHHLIPIKYQQEVWNKYSVNIDCVENIFSLCPNCHRAIHYGNDETKKRMLNMFFAQRQTTLKKIGVPLNYNDLLEMYNI